MKAINLVIRFVLELIALAALAYGAARFGPTSVLKPVFALLALVLTGWFWGSFVSPKARFGGSRVRRLALGMLVFALAAAALVVTGHVVAGAAFGAVCLVNTIATYGFGPQPGETSPS